MVHHAFTGQQDQEVIEVRVGGKRGHSAPAPMANDVHEAKGFEEAKLERASSACHHAGRIKVAARTLLSEPRSAGNEKTWTTWPSFLPKATLPFPRRRRPQCWRASHRPRMETLSRGARTMSTLPRCSSMSTAHAVLYRAPVMTVNGSRTCSPSSIPTSEGRSSAGA